MVVVTPTCIYLISRVESKDEKTKLNTVENFNVYVIIIGRTVNVEIFDVPYSRTFCTRPTILKFRAHKFSSVILA